jgi:lipopolysaccharide/colanic/teichoic acid biosynthesis glycosyltransferase
MLVKTLSLKGQPFGPLAKPATPHKVYGDSKFRHLVSHAHSLQDNILPHACSIAARWPLVKCSSKAGGGGVESTTRLGLFLKKIMDVVLSTIVLVLLWPLMLFIAIAIKLESPGPVIYRSLRLGKGGRKFRCYKFRTMVAGSDKLKENLRRLNQRRGPFFKIANDPRVTRLGRFLRKYSLDELPQLWNVLRGDMSLVGPRPHPLDDCARYRSEHRRRLVVKPGVTGLWQVLARANPSFEICMMLDLGYIEKWSLLLDCKILMKTIPAVMAGEGQ